MIEFTQTSLEAQHLTLNLVSLERKALEDEGPNFEDDFLPPLIHVAQSFCIQTKGEPSLPLLILTTKSLHGKADVIHSPTCSCVWDILGNKTGQV